MWVVVCQHLWLLSYPTRHARKQGLHKFHSANVGQFGKALQVLVALLLQQSLIGSLSRRSSIAIAGIKPIDMFHAVHDVSNGGKALGVQKGIAVRIGIDVDLRGSRVGPGRGKRDGTALVADLDGIVGNGGGPPLGLNIRPRGNPKLSDKAR